MYVSIIITCYNLENYISFAIESVLQQKFDQSKIEIIVVDDCSNDKSFEIIKSYSRVKYIQTPENSGVLLATILGMEESSGDLIFFLDGDDIWDNNKLTEMYNYFISDNNIVLLTHDIDYIDKNGNFLQKKSLPSLYITTNNRSKLDHLIRDGILLHKNYVWLGSAYAIRKSLSNLPAFFEFVKNLPDPSNTYQDWPLAFWVINQKNTKCSYINTKLLHYRLHGSNHSGDASSPEKAIRNVNRTLNTILAIKKINKILLLERKHDINNVIESKLLYYNYLSNLYNGNRLISISIFIKYFLKLSYIQDNILKEFLRLLIVQSIGLKNFTILLSFLNKFNRNK